MLVYTKKYVPQRIDFEFHKALKVYLRGLIINTKTYKIFCTLLCCLLAGNVYLVNIILVPRARRFLVTWSGNEGLWKQPLPDVRKFLTSGRACAELTNITAHAHNGFLSLTPPQGGKFYFLSSLQRVAFLGCFENAPLHSTWIH